MNGDDNDFHRLKSHIMYKSRDMDKNTVDNNSYTTMHLETRYQAVLRFEFGITCLIHKTSRTKILNGVPVYDGSLRGMSTTSTIPKVKPSRPSSARITTQ